MIPLTGWLAIAAIAAPLATYAWCSVDQALAVRDERKAQIEVCNGRIAAIGGQINAAAAKEVSEVRAAGDSIAPLTNKAALMADCKTNKMCKERGKLK